MDPINFEYTHFQPGDSSSAYHDLMTVALEASRAKGNMLSGVNQVLGGAVQSKYEDRRQQRDIDAAQKRLDQEDALKILLQKNDLAYGDQEASGMADAIRSMQPQQADAQQVSASPPAQAAAASSPWDNYDSAGLKTLQAGGVPSNGVSSQMSAPSGGPSAAPTGAAPSSPLPKLPNPPDPEKLKGLSPQTQAKVWGVYHAGVQNFNTAQTQARLAQEEQQKQLAKQSENDAVGHMIDKVSEEGAADPKQIDLWRADLGKDSGRVGKEVDAAMGKHIDRAHLDTYIKERLKPLREKAKNDPALLAKYAGWETAARLAPGDASHQADHLESLITEKERFDSEQGSKAQEKLSERDPLDPRYDPRFEDGKKKGGMIEDAPPDLTAKIQRQATKDAAAAHGTDPNQLMLMMTSDKADTRQFAMKLQDEIAKTRKQAEEQLWAIGGWKHKPAAAPASAAPEAAPVTGASILKETEGMSDAEAIDHIMKRLGLDAPKK